MSPLTLYCYRMTDIESLIRSKDLFPVVLDVRKPKTDESTAAKAHF